MNQYVNFIILGIIFIIIITSIIIVSINISKKNSVKKMYEDIEKLFSSIIPQNSDGYRFERKTNLEYDYLFETPNYKYYIKVIPNSGNQEICVNNSVKWQLRKSFNDESMRFVQNVEGLMRLEVEEQKKIKKLYIIYPNARSLLKYINECEMIFIHPDTDVYGCNIIPYIALKENKDLIKC